MNGTNVYKLTFTPKHNGINSYIPKFTPLQCGFRANLSTSKAWNSGMKTNISIFIPIKSGISANVSITTIVWSGITVHKAMISRPYTNAFHILMYMYQRFHLLVLTPLKSGINVYITILLIKTVVSMTIMCVVCFVCLRWVSYMPTFAYIFELMLYFSFSCL